MDAKKFLFIHQPKTAGYAFWIAFRELFGVENVSPHFSGHPLSAEQASAMRHCRVIAGHISRNDIDRFFSERRITLTVMRDPLERVLSQYFFFRHGGGSDEMAMHAQNNDIESYFSLPLERIFGAVANRIVRQLGDQAWNFNSDLDTAFNRAKETLKRCDWIAFYDDLERSIRKLPSIDTALSGLTLPRVRVTPPYPHIRDLAPKVKAKIIDLNHYDLDLYEWARIQFGSSAAI